MKESVVRRDDSVAANDLPAVIAATIALGALSSPSIISAQQTELPPTPTPIVQKADQTAQKEFVKVATEIKSIEELPGIFDAKSHVYFVTDPSIGSSTVSKAQLDLLAERLGPTDYYIVVVDTSKVKGTFGSIQDFTYTSNSSNGATRLSGYDAVYRFIYDKLVKGNGDFLRITDDSLGEEKPSASVFVLGVKDRKWSWFDSPFHNQLGIKAENTFVNNGKYSSIARPDFPRGRISDGVMKTVRAIDSDVDAVAGGLRKALAAKVSQAKGSIAKSEDALRHYSEVFAGVVAKYPGRGGDVFNPGEEFQPEEKISEAKRSLSAKDYDQAKKLGDQAQGEILTRVRLLTDYSSAEARFSSATATLKGATDSPFIFVVGDRLKNAETKLAQAQGEWKRGEATFSTTLAALEREVVEISGALVNGKKVYEKDADRIADIKDELAILNDSPFKEDIKDELHLTSENLTRAEEGWKQKSQAYPQLLQETEQSVEGLKTKVAELEAAEIAANRGKNIALSISGLFALIGLGGVGFRMRRVGLIAARAKTKFAELEGAFKKREEGLSLLERMQERALLKDGQVVQFENGSETEKKARAASEAVANLQLMQVAAHSEILAQASELLKKGGVVNGKNFESALRIMTDEAVEFSDENRAQLEEALSLKRQGMDALSVPLAELGTFSMSLPEIDERATKLAQVATSSLQSIIDAREGIATGLGSIKSIAQGLSARIEAINTESAQCKFWPGEFNLGDPKGLLAQVEKLVPALEREAAQDPVAVWQEFKDTQALFTALDQLLATAENIRKEEISSIGETKAALGKAGISCEWIDSSVKASSKHFTKVFSAICSEIGAQGDLDLEELQGELGIFTENQNLKERVAKAKEILASIDSRLPQEISDAQANVERVRALVVSETKAEVGDCLKEADLNPDQIFGTFKGLFQEVKTALADEDFNSAKEALAKIDGGIKRVGEICAQTEKHLATYKKNINLAATAIGDLEAKLPEREKVLNDLLSKYSEDTFKLGADVVEFEGHDGTVANNVSEITELLATAHEHHQAAVAAFASGHVYAAVQALVELGKVTDSCVVRFREISYVEGAVNRDLAEIEKGREKVAQQLEDLTMRATNFRVSAETVDNLRKVSESASQFLGTKRSRAKVNPFTILDGLKSANRDLKSIDTAIKEDIAEHGEALKAVGAVNEALQRLERAVATAQGDTLPDGASLATCQRELPSLRREAQSFDAMIRREERQDWADIETRADKLAAKIERVCEGLDQEMEEADEASSALKSAITSVNKAASWVGSYKVTIQGEPGKSELAEARTFLQAGRFVEALAAAKAAKDLASKAVKNAEARVSRERAKRAEAADRRANSRRRESSGGDYSSSFPDLPSVIIFNGGGSSGGGGGMPSPSLPDIDFSGVSDAVSGAVSNLGEGLGDIVSGATSDW